MAIYYNATSPASAISQLNDAQRQAQNTSLYQSVSPVKDSDLVWNFPFTTAPLQQRLTSGMAAGLFTPIYKLSTSVIGANKIAEYVLVTHDDDSPLELKPYSNNDTVLSTYDFVNRLEGFVGCYTIHSNLTPTQYVGIELGSIDQSPPFTTPSAGGVVQLRWVASTDTFELYSAIGDGVAAPVTTTLTGVSNIYGSNNVPHGVYMALEYDPINRETRAYINGVLGATIGGANFPNLAEFSHTGTHQIMSGIFITTGTSGSGNTAGFFGNFQHICKNVKPWRALG